MKMDRYNSTPTGMILKALRAYRDLCQSEIHRYRDIDPIRCSDAQRARDCIDHTLIPAIASKSTELDKAIKMDISERKGTQD